MSSDIKRRDLLKWLGNGCVIALGAELLAACESGDAAQPDSWPDSGFSPDAAPSADLLSGGEGGSEAFPFAPGAGDEPIYEGWPIRIVDVHDLQRILQRWTLRVEGLVRRPKTYRFADLLRLARQDMLVDLHCVEGWSVYDVPWNGLHLSSILSEVEPTAAATHVSFYTFDERYNESLPLEVALEPRTLLAYGVAERTLPFPRGFPLRLVVPRLLGYKSAKFVTRIELASAPIQGYWVKAGYGYEAEVQTARLREGKY